MERKTRRTVIAIPNVQAKLDFDDVEQAAAFTHPNYQRGLLGDRTVASLIDFALAGTSYGIFVAVTLTEMPASSALGRRVFGIYLAGFLLLLSVYYLLFMLSSSQTPGMKVRRLAVVDGHGRSLGPYEAFARGFGYLISIAPVFVGFLWAFIDPEHLTWTDKVSGTFIKKL